MAPMNAYLQVRLEERLLARFQKAAARAGVAPSAIARQLIAAYCDGRMTITPQQETLYVPRKAVE